MSYRLSADSRKQGAALLRQLCDDVSSLKRLSARIPNHVPAVTTSAFSSGPPASPQDGDLWVATGLAAASLPAATIDWTFRYDHAAAKWRNAGCPPLCNFGFDTWSQTTINAWQEYGGSTNYRVTLARPGRYVVDSVVGVQAAGGGTCYSIDSTIGGGIAGIYRQTSDNGQAVCQNVRDFAANTTVTLYVQSSVTGSVLWYPTLNIVPQWVT